MINVKALFGSGSEATESVEFRVFPKTGEARWLLEKRYRKPWHLKTWPRANLRAKIIYRVAWVLSMFGFHLPSRQIRIDVAPSSIYRRLRNEFGILAIFLGTPGPNRKIVVFAQNKERSIFVKIPLSEKSTALVENEMKAMALLHEDPVLTKLIPTAEKYHGYLATEDIEINGIRHDELDLREVLNVHHLLFQRSKQIFPIRSLCIACNVSFDAAVHSPSLRPHSEKVYCAINEVRTAARNLMSSFPEDTVVDCYMAHGDFTRWNVLVASDGSPKIIDWELYGLKPRFFDVIHYYASADILVEQKNSQEVIEHLIKVGEALIPETFCNELKWHDYFGIYFMIHSLHYCSIYEAQEEVSDIAVCQLRSWATALKWVLNRRI